MIAIEDQLDNVFFGHFGKLSGEYVLEVQKKLEGLVVAIVSDDPKGNFMFLLLDFGGIISRREA
jgi:hypothetical protein